ncbi:uncharacterized protein F4807DRAFT_449920 [Annulohypoxylon truncatum]|uniref:uncharacterized protein n=1 Tax=Annulohypoxylon truncatum TaxID=327061 RepID=UPI0020071E3F|nr:uncharacterized protein F4807DRAFT_449920 [Annulohypoxylon truncatum]KAI1213248.1 hypothetical protein F4807DRAFT_449920 [Annulohypoxylon truncatum]
MSRLLADEEQPLQMPDEGFINQEHHTSPKSHNRNTLTTQFVYILVLHLIIFILVGVIWGGEYRRAQLRILKGATWSPATDYIRYEIIGDHALKQNLPSVYSGPPSAENENAWQDLLTPMYFKATREEMLRGEQPLENGTQLTGGGYLATLGVYHELHCLRQLRLYLYRDYYYANLTSTQDEYLHKHLDHCLEALRIAIMCHGSTALYTFAWESSNPGRPTTKSNSRSVCVKWTSIKNWSYSREILESDQVVIPS